MQSSPRVSFISILRLGTKSETLYRYRSFLRDQLRSSGWNVNMVGSKRNGEMKDNVTIHLDRAT
jgi:hypothetical protein